jgi:hypothetical protein
MVVGMVGSGDVVGWELRLALNPPAASGFRLIFALGPGG